ENVRADIFVADALPQAEGWSGRLGAVVHGTESSPVLRLAQQSWEDFLQARSANFREQVRRRERSLAKQGLRFRFCESRDRLQRDLDVLFALHRRRWGDSVSEFTRRETFHREFAAVAFERGWLRLWFLELN